MIESPFTGGEPGQPHHDHADVPDGIAEARCAGAL